MGLFIDFQARLKNSGFWILSFLLSVYFAFHGINGERGFFRYLSLKQEIITAQQTAIKYNTEKTQLENKVKHLSNSSLDLDLLEERARIILNLAGDDEFILLDEED